MFNLDYITKLDIKKQSKFAANFKASLQKINSCRFMNEKKMHCLI